MLDLAIILLLVLIVFAYIGYPIISFVMSTLAPHKTDKDENLLPTVSLLIAAYNEEANIKEKIENSLELDYPREIFRIIVVSDGSTDSTDEIVRSFENRGVELLRVEGRVGKTQARNVAVAQNDSEIIVFSDATTIYDSKAIRKLVRNFKDANVGMVSGKLEYFLKESSSMGMATKLYWSYETLIKRTQSKLYTLTGAIGCINAFRRELYCALPANIIEDFTEPLAIVSNGHRVVFENEAIAYERTTQRSDQEFKMRVRVIRGGMTGAIYAFKVLKLGRRFGPSLQLVSHKILRWLVPVFLILLFTMTCLGAISNSVLAQGLLLAQILFYGLSLLSLFKLLPKSALKVMAIGEYFIVVNAASLKALYLSLTSDLEATWETNVY